MAFETGSAVDIADLFTKLLTFATANGWTSDEAVVTRNMPAMHKGGIWVQFRWDGTSPNANGRSVGVYQSIGFTTAGSPKPGFHPDDSGNGHQTSGTPTDNNLRSSRCIFELGDGPFVYWFFEKDASPAYLHCVVRKGTDVYRHFGFGELSKFADWNTATGGEYCYAHIVRSTTAFAAATDNHEGPFPGATSENTAQGFDCCPTMRAAGLPGQGGTEKWAGCMGNHTLTANANNRDRAAVQRALISGDIKGGPFGRALSFFRGYPGFSGMVPMCPVGAWLVRSGAAEVYFLGWWPDARFFNIGNFEPEAEVSIGGDTWVVFPVTKKSIAIGSSTSIYGGFAYKKVTA